MNRKNLIKPLLMGAMSMVLVSGFFSCGKENPDSPGTEFMPDMYRSPSLEAYNYIITKAGDTIWSARIPAAGSISRGNVPGMPVGMGYEQSVSLKNPLPNLATNRAMYEEEGKVIYDKFCTHCHGATGAGDGKVGGKMPGPPPSYTSANLKTLSEGKIFYSVSNGKGMMGPHAPLLSTEERWKVVVYVQKLQGPATDTTATTGAAAAADTTKK